MAFQYIWPIGLIVMSNVIYHICAKSIPDQMNPFASLTLTYLVGAAVSLILYFILSPEANLIKEYKSLNWAPLIFGIVIVGLEAGYIYAYKVGWPVGTAQIVQSAILAVVLIFVGFFLFHESITWNKIVGILVCLVGLGLISWK